MALPVTTGPSGRRASPGTSRASSTRRAASVPRSGSSRGHAAHLPLNAACRAGLPHLGTPARGIRPPAGRHSFPDAEVRRDTPLTVPRYGSSRGHAARFPLKAACRAGSPHPSTPARGIGHPPGGIHPPTRQSVETRRQLCPVTAVLADTPLTIPRMRRVEGDCRLRARRPQHRITRRAAFVPRFGSLLRRAARRPPLRQFAGTRRSLFPECGVSRGIAASGHAGSRHRATSRAASGR